MTSVCCQQIQGMLAHAAEEKCIHPVGKGGRQEDGRLLSKRWGCSLPTVNCQLCEAWLLLSLRAGLLCQEEGAQTARRHAFGDVGLVVGPVRLASAVPSATLSSSVLSFFLVTAPPSHVPCSPHLKWLLLTCLFALQRALELTKEAQGCTFSLSV